MSKVKHGKRQYKQMALEVAIRNPERLYDFLVTFSKFEGRNLDDACILEIYAQLYIDKVIVAQNVDFEVMTKNQIYKYIKDNNTHQNEWGFPTGYQAAFCRYLKTLSEFGFIYSQYNETFKLSDVAKTLINGDISLSEAFSLQCVRFWRKSPYRRVLNDFNYFTFLLNALIELDKKGKRMSINQFMYSLFSIDGNIDEFLDDLDSHHIGDSPEKAYDLVIDKYLNNSGKYKKISKMQTAFRDYGNTVFRVLQLTGFVSVDSSGIIMLSINKNRLNFYKELLAYNFVLTEEAKEDETLYFNEIGFMNESILNSIIKYREEETTSTNEYNDKIKNIISSYNLDQESLSTYLLDLSSGKRDSGCFWFLQAPLKLEFLLTLFLYTCYGDEFNYQPNYKCDDNGIPYSHAPGNVGDIEIFNASRYWLIEATLIRNKNQQINNETINLFRHISDKQDCDKYLSLVAPYIHEDTELMIKVASLIVGVEKKTKIYAGCSDVNDFVKESKLKNNFLILEGINRELINGIKEYL